MVSHSHLSAGNTESSQSQDLFTEFGVSRPSSPPLSSPLFLSSDDMAESDPVPLAIASSSGVATSLDKAAEVDVGPVLGQGAQDIFKSAQYFSRKDGEEALVERKKNQHLFNFISVHGFSSNDVNSFISAGKLADSRNAHQVSKESSSILGMPSGSRLPPLEMVTCVDEVPCLNV